MTETEPTSFGRMLAKCWQTEVLGQVGLRDILKLSPVRYNVCVYCKIKLTTKELDSASKYGLRVIGLIPSVVRRFFKLAQCG